MNNSMVQGLLSAAVYLASSQLQFDFYGAPHHLSRTPLSKQKQVPNLARAIRFQFQPNRPTGAPPHDL
eukprot:scaffold29871_cov40-Cyclotella_meneghiniana.AAC.1